MHVVRTRNDFQARLREKTKRVERQRARIEELEARLEQRPATGVKGRLRSLLGR